MRLRGPRVTLLAGLAGAAALVVAPSLVAEAYDGDGIAGARPTSFLTRPDRGWHFVYDAVRLSRGARLGSGDAALREAQRRWAGPPAVAESVRLVYADGPLQLPVPSGGSAHARPLARPRSPLSWLVEGRVGSGIRQTIGVMDYQSGRVVWDIRPLRRAP